MNEDEIKGGARNLGGKIEKAAGDIVGSQDLKTDGVIDQVGGTAQRAYGQAKSLVEDAADAVPDLLDEGRERLKQGADRALVAAQNGGRIASDTVKETPALWIVAAALGSLALAWFVSSRDR